ncbi:MAG TPA: PhzF family phenazine biosynthesis protein [Gemmatimonadaceae bacterium]|nr:PhzF family phenazine biosynthesis protein [Gemmatimonadaceae bacterium]
MQRRYVTVDVFTERVFGGNPLAVVLDAEGLTSAQMQAIATEFNYSETTFVLPPQFPEHSARVRIFTPRTEVPFAGHPNVGTAVVFARERGDRRPPLDRIVFEEAAGLVPIRLVSEQSKTVGAEFMAPQSLAFGSVVSAADVAECLSLAASDINLVSHSPQVLSVGLPFAIAELVSRDALRRAKPNLATHERVLTPIGTDAIFCYCRAAPHELHARMFAPLDSIVEDPATGSAAAATISRLASLQSARDGDVSWRIEQGVDMGRPSLIRGRTERSNGTVTAVHIGGQVVPVMSGVLDVPEF